MGVKTRKLGNINDSLIQWQAVVVADGSTGLTAVAGRGYFINTTSATQTVTLPASPAIGDTISIVDYASTFATNNVTVDPGSNKIEGLTTDATLNTNDQTHTLVFTDSTQGWKIVNQDTASSIQPLYTAATGGTVTTSGNFKIHTFTGDGNFVVSSVGNAPGGSDAVSYLVVAGGGGGGGGSGPGTPSGGGGGGGAGGYREGKNAPKDSYTASPLNAPAGLTVTATTFPVTVGAGAVGGTQSAKGGTGSNSVFSTITSAGGGGGAFYTPPSSNHTGLNGGSGGGGAGPSSSSGGSGNTPPVSPPQGNNGGGSASSSPAYAGNAGGGAGAVGGNLGPSEGGAGGNGVTTEITASPVAYAGGGGGGSGGSGGTANTGGTGGGAAGGYRGQNGPNGTANTGGGAGGAGQSCHTGGTGGKGIVIIRYKFQN